MLLPLVAEILLLPPLGRHRVRFQPACGTGSCLMGRSGCAMKQMPLQVGTGLLTAVLLSTRVSPPVDTPTATRVPSISTSMLGRQCRTLYGTACGDFGTTCGDTGTNCSKPRQHPLRHSRCHLLPVRRCPV